MARRAFPLNLASQIYDKAEFETQKSNHFEVHLRVPTAVKNTMNALQSGETDPNALSKDYDKVITLACQSFSLPTFSLETANFSYANTKVKYASTPNISGADSLSCIDFIGADLEGIIYAWYCMAYNPETGQMGWAANYKSTGTVIEYAPDGSCVSEWRLVGVWVSELNPGSLDRSSGDMKKVEVKLTFDNAFRVFDPKNSRTTANAKEAQNQAAYMMAWQSPDSYISSNNPAYMKYQETNGQLGVPWSVESSTDTGSVEPNNGATYDGPSGYVPNGSN